MTVDRQEPEAAELHKLIDRTPKCELHVHIEGTFEPELMLTIAKRNKLEHLLPFNDLQSARAAYDFTSLQSFLDLYFLGCKVLVTEQDYYDLMMAYLQRATAANVKHAEIFFDPQSGTERGIAFSVIFNGLYRATQDAKASLGIDAKLIMCFLRHLGAEAAMKSLHEALPYKEHILAVGLDSTELGYPPSMFKEIFDAAKSQGYLPGEEGPPSYIWEAIRELGVKRIDHGIRCVEDEELLKYLEDTQLPLTLCPLSNHKLKVYDGTLDEKLKKLLSHNLCATINSDDPSYFGGYIDANFKRVADRIGLTADGIHRLVQNSFRAAFIPESEKIDYLKAVDGVFTAASCSS